MRLSNIELTNIADVATAVSTFNTVAMLRSCCVECLRVALPINTSSATPDNLPTNSTPTTTNNEKREF